VRWKLTVRSGPRVTRTKFGTLEQALGALKAQAQELSDSAPRQAVDARIRRFEPVQQVIARLELAGPERLSPTVRAGIDVRGDGSTEAFLGRLGRRVVEQREREDSYEALGRAVRDRLG
jgi:hypothetical protein